MASPATAAVVDPTAVVAVSVVDHTRSAAEIAETRTKTTTTTAETEMAELRAQLRALSPKGLVRFRRLHSFPCSCLKCCAAARRALRRVLAAVLAQDEQRRLEKALQARAQAFRDLEVEPLSDEEARDAYDIAVALRDGLGPL